MKNYRKIVALLALFATFFGCAFSQANSASSAIQLHVFDSSSSYWLAVDPRDDDDDTVAVEMQEAGSSAWTEMTHNAAWGYWHSASRSASGFTTPLSFRLTSSDGEQVTVSDALVSVTPGSLVNTRAAWRSHHHNSQTQAPTQEPAASTNGRASTSTSAAASSSTSAESATTSSAASSSSSTASASTSSASSSTSAAASTSTSGSTSGSTDLCAVTATSSEPLKILVPLYSYPGSDWDNVASAASAGAQIIAIINPSSGPISSGPDSTWTTYMNKLTAAGVDMVGYVHTSYGARASSDVTGDVDVYASMYPGLKGIFLDEVSADASEISYYQTVYSHISGISGYANTILNPGTQPDEGYLAVSTSIVIFESPASSLSSNFDSWVTCASSASEKSGYKYHFAGIAYGASSSEMSSVLSTMEAAGMGLVYVTDGASGCCTYNTLASYFSSEASAVAALN